MKTFLATFAAILCAAAVLLGGGYYFITTKQAKDRTVVASVKTIIEADETASGSLGIYYADIQRNGMAAIPLMDRTLAAVKDALKVGTPKEKLRERVLHIVTRYRGFMQDAMAKKWAEESWAKELGAKLSELEELVK